MRRERIARREYFSIGEVCEMAGLKPHVLRYWETQFKELSPSKNRAGNRVYRAREIKLIELVKHLLYEEKYTMAVALFMFKSQYGSYWGQLMAVSTCMILPIIILFFFTQRTFIQGIKLTGMKG